MQVLEQALAKCRSPHTTVGVRKAHVAVVGADYIVRAPGILARFPAIVPTPP